ncbi:unnamed protein product, partial [Anisakis simplex]|uniref:AP2/ERF domain-containing protein n=1 Tax=Anisakis simplex TaxID=6269 RepID=A0A0M3JPU9_ANISI
MPGYNPHDQSLYYFPPPSIPRPDGKYVRTRSQKWMNAAKKADLPALEVFVRTQGKVNFTIRNLGRHPAYGPFSLSSAEFSKTNSRTAQKEMPTKET